MKVSTNLSMAVLAVLAPLSNCQRLCGPALDWTRRSGGEGKRDVVTEYAPRCQIHGVALRRGRVKSDLGYLTLLCRSSRCLGEKKVKFPNSNLWTRGDYVNQADRQGYIDVFYCKMCRETERRYLTEGALKNLAQWATQRRRLTAHNPR